MAKERKLFSLQYFTREKDQAEGYNLEPGQEIPKEHELYGNADLMVNRQQAEWKMVEVSDKKEEKK